MTKNIDFRYFVVQTLFEYPYRTQPLVSSESIHERKLSNSRYAKQVFNLDQVSMTPFLPLNWLGRRTEFYKTVGWGSKSLG